MRETRAGCHDSGGLIRAIHDGRVYGIGPAAIPRDRPVARPAVRAHAIARVQRRSLLHLLLLSLILAGAFLSVFYSQAFPFQVQSSVAITGLSLPSIGASPNAEEPVLTSAVLPRTIRRDEQADALQALSGVAPVASSVAEAPVTAVAEAGLEAEALTPYVLYAVGEGDTASTIAFAFGIDLQYLLWANPDLRDGELLTIGQVLIVPAGNGILHDVRYGETLSDIAARYGVDVSAILGWASNGITSADQVVEDQLIFVPDGVMPVSALPVPTAVPENPVTVPVPAPVPPPPAPAAPAPASVTGLIWPVYGPISSYMDASHPLGIDIDLYNSPGAAIGAATSGTVTFSGGDPCCSYGLYVVLVSPDGIETLYGHLSALYVSAGQVVSQGESLGLAGCTGYCTGTHLHFEVIDNGVRVNPLSYLP